MSEAPTLRRLYRIVAHNPPVIEDFLSYRALGRPLRRQHASPAEIAAWEAISTYVTEGQARLRAVRNRELGARLGDFIAEPVLPADVPAGIGPVSRAGHCDVTAEPATLLEAVASVVPV